MKLSELTKLQQDKTNIEEAIAGVRQALCLEILPAIRIEYPRSLMQLRTELYELNARIDLLGSPLIKAKEIVEPFKNKPRRIIRANRYYHY